MMVINPFRLPNKTRFSLPFLYKPITGGGGGGRSSCSAFTCRSVSSVTSFTWDDVVQASLPVYAPNDSSDLSGFFEKIKSCNRGSSEIKSEFIPLVIEDQIVGYIHNGDSRFGTNVTLNKTLSTPEERTRVVGKVIKCLAEEDKELIPGIRNELYPVTPSFGSPPYFSLERAAAPYFGIKAYGVHMNGFVKRDGEKFLWIGKRSPMKQTFPGMLDHLVAGGLPHGMSCVANLIKECEEEAGIPLSLSNQAMSVGAVSYADVDRYRYKRDVLFCYDLELPGDFIPKNQDGEVDSFNLIPVENVANVIRRTHFFKPNCSLVIMDFLFRHGYISPECLGYLDLLQSLRSGDTS
ncbi:PREDICTED: nudix hydrolase 20, chloroplastic-like isoform X2 [Populus euphratica]|uniref:Nudix hydrolase 20, chloroplastic-like isoform X2 n=1 Tax=Populus euphratica TaxID=75702 RepID=A0AAJ6Y735_POPEU|nr:PREDICTED: nudix hydrolase 20, chloroplastic-like isoform X2 [Populus euphratica]